MSNLFNRESLARWNGFSWQEVGKGSMSGTGISSIEGEARTPSIAITIEGTIYVAWSHFFDHKPQLYVKQWDGNDWRYVYDEQSSEQSIGDAQGSFHPKIEANSQGILYMLWTATNQGVQSFYIKQWNGEEWAEVAPGSASGYGIGYVLESSGIKLENDYYMFWPDHLPSLAIAPNDDLFVAWPENLTTIAVRHLSFGQTEWHVIDYKGNFETHPELSLAVGPDNVAYLAWEGKIGFEYGIYVLYWDHNSWKEVVRGSSLANGIGDGKTFNDKPTIVTAPDNVIYVVWEAVPQKGKLNSRYIYVRHWHNSG